MAESVIFVLIGGFISVWLIYVFDLTFIHPLWIIIFLGVLIIPGFYGAVTSGPFVPSARKRHKIMMKLADLKSSDVVYDLGCGDGRLVFHSAKSVKKAIGYEISIPLYLFGRIRQLFSRKGFIRYGNIWKQDYSDADVIFCYLLPNAMNQFYKEIWPDLKKGTRVISNAFQMHDLAPAASEEKVYMYVKR